MLILRTQNGWKIITRIFPRPRPITRISPRPRPITRISPRPRPTPSTSSSLRGLLRRRGCACGCWRPSAPAAAAAAAAASAPARVAGAVNKPVYAWPGVSCCCNNLKWAAFKRAENVRHSGGPAGRRMQPRQGPKQLMNMSCNAIYHDHPCIYTVLSLRRTEKNIGYT